MKIPKFDMRKYMSDQIDAIKTHKWITSEKVGFDRGDEAIKEWLDRYANKFREDAENSEKYKSE